MIIFLYGEDSFRSYQKLSEYKDRFRKKDETNMNLQILDGSKIDFSGIRNSVMAAPFFGDNKLVIIDGILQRKDKDLHESLAELIKAGVPESSVVIFREEGEIDKRLKLTKALLKDAQAEEFKYLSGNDLNKWVGAKITELEAKIDTQAINKLVANVGNDMWQLQSELEKLATYKNGEEIRVEDVDLLVRAKLDDNIFNFVDAIGNRDKSTALKLLQAQLELGENGLYLLSMLNYQFRNMLVVKELLDSGRNQNEAGKEAKMHPFVFQKTSGQVRSFDYNMLKAIYNKLLNLDVAIKTGKIEAELGLNLLVVGLCG